MSKNSFQKTFFNNIENQYDKQRILKPPLHTKLELEQIIKHLKHIAPKSRIIDFGAGSGRLSIPLLQKGFQVLAIDVSETSLRNLQETASSMSLPKPRTAAMLPEDSESAAIVGADILHHIDLDTYLPLFYKALKKDGIAVFSEPCAYNLSWYFYLPFASQWKAEKGILTCTYFNLKKKFLDYGFSEVKISGLGMFPRPLFQFSKTLCEFNDALGNLPFFKLFSYRFLIVARK